MEQAPWLAIFPGLAISLAVLAFNLFGDTLRDAWDPKLRGTASPSSPCDTLPAVDGLPIRREETIHEPISVPPAMRGRRAGPAAALAQAPAVKRRLSRCPTRACSGAGDRRHQRHGAVPRRKSAARGRAGVQLLARTMRPSRTWGSPSSRSWWSGTARISSWPGVERGRADHPELRARAGHAAGGAGGVHPGAHPRRSRPRPASSASPRPPTSRTTPWARGW